MTLGSGGGNRSSSGGEGGEASSSTRMVTVPDLTGKTQQEAAEAVRAAGFTNEIDTSGRLACEENSTPVGRIDCQNLEPGKSVQAYSMIAVHIKSDGRMSGIVHRDDFEKMRGMTVDQAKAYAKKIGHTGVVTVEVSDDVMDCTENTVCKATDFHYGQSGMGLDDALILTTKKPASPTAE